MPQLACRGDEVTITAVSRCFVRCSSSKPSFSLVSVRARIIVLGVIPVIGFLANGIAFMAGDVEVGRAFDSVHRYSQVADASRDLKTGLLIMRAATTQFVARPSDKAWCAISRTANSWHCKSLERIAEPFGASAQDVITPLRITVRDLKTSFESLTHEEEALGFTETEGISAELTQMRAARWSASSTKICRGSPTATPAKC